MTGGQSRWPVVMVSLALLLIGAVAVFGGLELSSRQDRIIGCVTGYSNALADTLDKRTAATQQAQESLDRVMEAVSKAFHSEDAATAARVRSAIENYVELRTKTKDTQARNPLPQPPRDVCRNLID